MSKVEQEQVTAVKKQIAVLQDAMWESRRITQQAHAAWRAGNGNVSSLLAAHDQASKVLLNARLNELASRCQAGCHSHK